jgi:chromosome segregation ATPase
MHVLENKQKVLEVTKQSSTQLEIKVKQLKDEALASRHQLEDLRRREQVLEHDRDVAVKEKNQIKHKKGLLQDSVDQLRARCEREMALLQNDLSVLVNELKQMTDRNMKLMDAVDRKIKQRQQCLEDLYLMKKQLRSNTEAFVEKVRTELQEFKTEIKQSALQTKDCTHAAIQCRGEVNGLVTKIKTIAAEITASEEKH